MKASFKFTSGRGAVLAMENDILVTISPPGILRHLLDSEELQQLVDNNKNLVLVSEVHQSSSYARFLSSKAGATVTLALSAELPVANVGGANVDAKWVYSNSAGNFKSKVNKDGERIFYPLFRLVSLKEGPLSTGMRGEAGLLE
ncbi:hypothetical protein BYT27DRAFT_6872560 [Phlegmacium glaucopus]|nr:hypothetical protein BYT27DRAFT_6872560 [Phlegmacium glaucopus]